MVDIHCHILPGVDDGAKTWDVAVEMCRMAAEDGIQHIVATPHANHEFSYNRESHAERLALLKERVGDKPELSLGCDFHFSFENLRLLMEDRSRFTINSTQYLLVELSDYAIPPRFDDHLRDLVSSGIRPIITHPERNGLLQQRPEPILDWVKSGALIQVTANTLTGMWGKTALKIARWLLDNNAVHVVATDAHNTHRRPPLLSAARRLLAEWKGEVAARSMVQDVPTAIIHGDSLPIPATPVI